MSNRIRFFSAIVFGLFATNLCASSYQSEIRNLDGENRSPGTEGASHYITSSEDSDIDVWTREHWTILADWAESALASGMPDEDVAAFVEYQTDILIDIANQGSNGGGGGGAPDPGPGFGIQCWACDGNQTPDPVYPESVELPNDVGYFYQVVGGALTIGGAASTGGTFIVIGTLIIWINDSGDGDGGSDDESK